MRASGCVTRKCMRVMRVRAWGCARVRVRMREGGSGWTGVCWRVISEGCGWRSGVSVGIRLAGWLGGAGSPKVGGQCGPEREPKGEREGRQRTQGKQGGGGSRANTLHIFSRGFFGTMGLRTFPYGTLKSAGDWFSGPVPKKLYYL